MRHASGCSSLFWLQRSEAKSVEPLQMILTGHELGRTFTYAHLNPTAQVAPMIQEKLQQVQVRSKLTAQCEIVPKPRIQILDQRT
ncbi:MAG: hypothetical protein H7232_09040 [Aeromicrobium sp.]|nr:hypothetical protein [Burkholderiales bacterium]